MSVCARMAGSAPFISRVNGVRALFHDSGGSSAMQQPDQVHDGRTTGQQMEVWHRQVATVGIQPRAGGGGDNKSPLWLHREFETLLN